jgi:hypothetical protein
VSTCPHRTIPFFCAITQGGIVIVCVPFCPLGDFPCFLWVPYPPPQTVAVVFYPGSLVLLFDPKVFSLPYFWKAELILKGCWHGHSLASSAGPLQPNPSCWGSLCLCLFQSLTTSDFIGAHTIQLAPLENSLEQDDLSLATLPEILWVDPLIKALLLHLGGGIGYGNFPVQVCPLSSPDSRWVKDVKSHVKSH